MEDYERCFSMQPRPKITDGLYSLAQMHEKRGDMDAAVSDYQRILRCTEEDYGTVPGADREWIGEQIERLRGMMSA